MITCSRMLLLAAGFFAAHMSVAVENERSASSAFQSLSGLVGNWQGKLPDGRTHRVNYRLSAGGSALVETWALSAGRESITIYHLDGDALLADHYCVQGNQPRLRWVNGDGNGFSFAFRDGVNLQVAGKSHQHAFWIALHGNDAFERSETYVENGAAPVEATQAAPDAVVSYTRLDIP
ncbi:MAG: hypothetical protein ABI411_04685 [Tahibacter sp.]